MRERRRTLETKGLSRETTHAVSLKYCSRTITFHPFKHLDVLFLIKNLPFNVVSSCLFCFLLSISDNRLLVLIPRLRRRKQQRQLVTSFNKTWAIWRLEAGSNCREFENIERKNATRASFICDFEVCGRAEFTGGVKGFVKVPSTGNLLTSLWLQCIFRCPAHFVHTVHLLLKWQRKTTAQIRIKIERKEEKTSTFWYFSIILFSTSLKTFINTTSSNISLPDKTQQGLKRQVKLELPLLVCFE